MDQFHSFERRGGDEAYFRHLENLPGELLPERSAQIGQDVLSDGFEQIAGPILERGADLIPDGQSLLAGWDKPFRLDRPQCSRGDLLSLAVHFPVFIGCQIVSSVDRLDFPAGSPVFFDPVRIRFSFSHIQYLYRYYII